MSPAPAEIGGQYDRICNGGLACGFPGANDSKGSSDPRSWSEEDLGRWLASRGLPPDIPKAFEVHLVNGLLAEDLNEMDLASMGITDALHQRRVTLELRQLFSSGTHGACSKSLRKDLSIRALAPAATPAPAYPAAPTARRAKPRPQSARCHPNSASVTYLPMKSSGRLESQVLTKSLLSVSGGSSPYMQAVPRRRSRPRSANSVGCHASRDPEWSDGRTAAASTPMQSAAHSFSMPAPPPPRALSPMAAQPEMPFTPAVSSTALPTAAPQPHRQRSVPPLPSAPIQRVGAPPPQTPLPPSRSAHEHEAARDREMRMGVRTLRASRERIGVQYGTGTPPLAHASPASTPMQGCHSDSAAVNPREIAEVTAEATAASGGNLATIATRAPGCHSLTGTTATPTHEHWELRDRELVERWHGVDLLQTHHEVLAKRRAMDMLENQVGSHAGLDVVACSERSLGGFNHETQGLTAAERHAEAMRVMALGGHTSVADLLFERDTLAAALAAEQRRACEFEQLWRRAEQELQHYRAIAAISASVSLPSRQEVISAEDQHHRKPASQETSIAEFSISASQETSAEPADAQSPPLPQCCGDERAQLAALTDRLSVSAIQLLTDHLSQSSPQPSCAHPATLGAAVVPTPVPVQEALAASVAAAPRSHTGPAPWTHPMHVCRAAPALPGLMETALLPKRPVPEEATVPAAALVPPSGQSSGHSAAQLDSLCQEFRLQVRDMVAAAVGPPFPDPMAEASNGPNAVLPVK